MRDLLDEDVLSLVARGEASSIEVTRACLERIEQRDGSLGSTVTVLAESALAEAAARDADRAAGRALGPLHGVPVGIKDNIDVAGAPTHVGSAFFPDPVGADAPCVARLRAAGAVVVAKLALHEMAYGVTCVNRHHGDCHNAWDATRIPGGSSAGSAVAVAAGLVPVALGTDTGGSVRIPAALNGVSALRPTPGLVPTAGVFPVSWTYDTVGPIARTVAGLAAAARALLPADARDPAAGLHAGVAGLRVGIPTTFFLEDTDAEIVAATHAAVEALRDAGAEIVDVAVPGAERSHAIMRTLITAEAYAVHRRRLAEEPERFGDDVRERLLIGASVRGADYAEAREQARVYAHVALRMFDTCDVVLAPTTGTAAPRIADSETIATTDRLTRATYAWSLAGLPTVAVPAGLTTEGLPIGIQLAAAPGRDALALRAAAAHQAVTAWHTRVPDPV